MPSSKSTVHDDGSLVVLLGDLIAGTLTRLAGGRLRFNYDEQYRATNGATPLSVSMQTPIASHLDAAIAPWLAGLLPDNDAVLARWSRDFHTSRTPFALLSTPVGRDCAGAVRFAHPDEVEDLLAAPGTVSWLSEPEVAGRLRALRADSTAWLGSDFTGQFSLAGAQAKTALLFEDGRWGVPSGSTATSHVLKPAVAGLDDHDLNEHICLDAARRAGLIAARTRVARFEDQSAIVVDRYDRRTVGDRLVRIHQEDLCQALGTYPADKYENQGGPGARDVARLLRQVMPSAAAERAIWQFADALAWNWLIAGTDAHAKNYSLLLSGADVRLAPLYDVASALPYGMSEHKLRFAMKVGGDYDVYSCSRNTWAKAAHELRLDADAVATRIRELAERTPDALRDAAAAPGVAELDSPLPTRLVDLVAARVSRLMA